MSSSQRRQWSRFARDNNYGSESNHPRVEISLRKIKSEFYKTWENIKADSQIDESIDSNINRFVINHVIRSNGKRFHDCLAFANDLKLDLNEICSKINSKEENIPESRLCVNVDGDDENTTNLQVDDIVFVKNSNSDFTKAIISQIEEVKYHEQTVRGSTVLRRFYTVKQVNYYVKYEQRPGSNEFSENKFIVKWEYIYRNINPYYQWFKMVEIMIVYVNKYIINNYSNDITFVTDEYSDRLKTLNENIRDGVTSKYNSLSYNSFAKNLTMRVDSLNNRCDAEISHLRERSTHWWYGIWKNYNIDIDYYMTFKKHTLLSFKNEIEETIQKYICLRDSLNDIRKYLLRIKEEITYKPNGHIANPKLAFPKLKNIIILVTHAHTRILGDYNIT